MARFIRAGKEDIDVDQVERLYLVQVDPPDSRSLDIYFKSGLKTTVLAPDGDAAYRRIAALLEWVERSPT